MLAAKVILTIVQARISSTRLPGKVMKTILGEPMLFRQLERVQRAQHVGELVVATSENAEDDVLVDACRARGISCQRGSLDDVLDRFYSIAESYQPEHVVRLTGDCPLADAAIIDALIEFYVDGQYDYASNTIVPTFPDGLDAEVFSCTSLRQAWREARRPSEREHVTPFIKNNEALHRGNFAHASDYSHYRWTVDDARDFELVTRIFEALHPQNRHFGWRDVLELLNTNPQLKTINAGTSRDEGYAKSVRADAEAPHGTSHQLSETQSGES